MVVSKGKLKSKMLEYFREVERTGEPLIVTDHGREVLEVRPVAPVGSRLQIIANLRAQLFGNEMAGAITDEALLEPVWREEDEADDSWWIEPKPNS